MSNKEGKCLEGVEYISVATLMSILSFHNPICEEVLVITAMEARACD
jgi:hypothetical protein